MIKCSFIARQLHNPRSYWNNLVKKMIRERTKDLKVVDTLLEIESDVLCAILTTKIIEKKEAEIVAYFKQVVKTKTADYIKTRMKSLYKDKEGTPQRKFITLPEGVDLKQFSNRINNYGRYSKTSSYTPKTPTPDPSLFMRLLKCGITSARDIEVVEMMMKGKSQSFIANELNISQQRVSALIFEIKSRINNKLWK